MAKKTREQVTKEILDVDFENIGTAKDFDDDGYEEGKSKEREMTANASVSDSYKGGLLYKGKSKNYTSAADLIKKKEAKIIKLNPNKKKKD
jgi:hypothetical protein